MKLPFILFALFCSTSLFGQMVYTDAAQFPLLGKSSDATETPYERLPASCQKDLRPGLVGLGQCSAGLAIRFRSNTTAVAVKWETRNNSRMMHMTPTGICGLDLYCLEGNKWHFVGTAQPQDKYSERTIVQHMEPKDREFMMYLPLYDGATSIQIGVDSLSELSQPAVDLPRREKPIVFYGTSILQGGCANRPGMAHTSILERWLQRECINLGFSGNARLDMEIAEVMAGVDASIFVIDCLPNVSIDRMNERMEKFYKVIRQKHPKTPIVFVENPRYPNALYDVTIAEELDKENKWLKKFVSGLRRGGDKHAHFFSAEYMTGTDGEASVDGCHFTDLGFMRAAEAMYPLLKKLLR